MKKFITDYMAVLDKKDDTAVRELERRFVEACSVLKNQLGERPFHLRQRINLAALDSVMATAVESVDSLVPNLNKAYVELKADSDFDDTVTYNTSDTAVVQQRLALVQSAFGVSE